MKVRLAYVRNVTIITCGASLGDVRATQIAAYVVVTYKCGVWSVVSALGLDLMVGYVEERSARAVSSRAKYI